MLGSIRHSVICLAVFTSLALVGTAKWSHAQVRVELPSQSAPAVRQASLRGDAGILAARLEASRGTQIRVTAHFLLVDTPTREAIYKNIGPEAIKTKSSRIPVAAAKSTSGQSGSHLESFQGISTTSLVSTGVLSRASADQVIGMVKTAPQSGVAKSPSIIVLDGQSAEYNDIAQRPFVVGVERIEGGVHPIVQVFDEGTKIRVGGRLGEWSGDAPRKIHLSGEISWQKLLDVRSDTVFGMEEEPTTVQVPSHLVKRVDVAEELAEGQALLVDPYVKQTVNVQNEANVPMLKKLPYLGRTFKNNQVAKVDRHIMVLLQPGVE